jgi:hypothetical protein
MATRKELEAELDGYMKQLGNLYVRRSKAVERKLHTGKLDSIIAGVEADIARVKKELQ